MGLFLPGGGGSGSGGPAPNTILWTTAAQDHLADAITILIPRIEADESDFSRRVPIVTDRVAHGSNNYVVTFVEQLAGSPYTALTLDQPLASNLDVGEVLRIDRLLYAEVAQDTIDGALVVHGTPVQPTLRISGTGTGNHFDVTFRSLNGQNLGPARNGTRIRIRTGRGGHGFFYDSANDLYDFDFTGGTPSLSELRNFMLQDAAEFFTPSAITGTGNVSVVGTGWTFMGGTSGTPGSTSLTFDNTLEPIEVGDVVFFRAVTPTRRRVITAVDHSSLGTGSIVTWADELDFAYADGETVDVERPIGYFEAVASAAGPRGIGQAPYFDYSTDGTSWDENYTDGDIFFRVAVSNERPAAASVLWSEAIRFQGPVGPIGPTGFQQFLSFSADNSSWHETLATTDRFIRFVLAATRPAESSSDWSTGVRFVGQGTIEASFLLSNHNGNLSSALTGFNGGTVTLGADFSTADPNQHSLLLRAPVEAAHGTTGQDPAVIRFRMLSGTTVLAEQEATITSNSPHRYFLDAIVAPVGSITIRADWISGTTGETVSVTLANQDRSVSLYAQVIPRDSIDRTARTILASLHTLRATRVDSEADFNVLRNANPPSNVAVATSAFNVTPSNHIVDMTAAQISSVAVGDVFFWDRNSLRWDRVVDFPTASEQPGTPGAAGTSIFIGFSADNSSWHETAQTGDLFIRFASGTSRPDESSGAWGAGIRFVGMDGTDSTGSGSPFPRAIQTITSTSSSNPGTDANSGTIYVFNGTADGTITVHDSNTPADWSGFFVNTTAFGWNVSEGANNIVEIPAMRSAFVLRASSNWGGVVLPSDAAQGDLFGGGYIEVSNGSTFALGTSNDGFVVAPSETSAVGVTLTTPASGTWRGLFVNNNGSGGGTFALTFGGAPLITLGPGEAAFARWSGTSWQLAELGGGQGAEVQGLLGGNFHYINDGETITPTSVNNGELQLPATAETGDVVYTISTPTPVFSWRAILVNTHSTNTFRANDSGNNQIVSLNPGQGAIVHNLSGVWEAAVWGGASDGVADSFELAISGRQLTGTIGRSGSLSDLTDTVDLTEAVGGGTLRGDLLATTAIPISPGNDEAVIETGVSWTISSGVTWIDRLGTHLLRIRRDEIPDDVLGFELVAKVDGVEFDFVRLLERSRSQQHAQLPVRFAETGGIIFATWGMRETATADDPVITLLAHGDTIPADATLEVYEMVVSPGAPGDVRGALLGTTNTLAAATPTRNSGTALSDFTWTAEANSPDYVTGSGATFRVAMNADTPDNVDGIWIVAFRQASATDPFVEQGKGKFVFGASRGGVDDHTMSISPTERVALQSEVIANNNLIGYRAIGAGTTLPVGLQLRAYWSVTGGPRGESGDASGMADSFDLSISGNELTGTVGRSGTLPDLTDSVNLPARTDFGVGTPLPTGSNTIGDDETAARFDHGHPHGPIETISDIRMMEIDRWYRYNTSTANAPATTAAGIAIATNGNYYAIDVTDGGRFRSPRGAMFGAFGTQYQADINEVPQSNFVFQTQDFGIYRRTDPADTSVNGTGWNDALGAHQILVSDGFRRAIAINSAGTVSAFNMASSNAWDGVQAAWVENSDLNNIGFGLMRICTQPATTANSPFTTGPFLVITTETDQFAYQIGADSQVAAFRRNITGVVPVWVEITEDTTAEPWLTNAPNDFAIGATQTPVNGQIYRITSGAAAGNVTFNNPADTTVDTRIWVENQTLHTVTVMQTGVVGARGTIPARTSRVLYRQSGNNQNYVVMAMGTEVPSWAVPGYSGVLPLSILDPELQSTTAPIRIWWNTTNTPDAAHATAAGAASGSSEGTDVPLGPSGVDDAFLFVWIGVESSQIQNVFRDGTSLAGDGFSNPLTGAAFTVNMIPGTVFVSSAVLPADQWFSNTITATVHATELGEQIDARVLALLAAEQDVFIQYSSDGTSWHTTQVTGDSQFRISVGQNQPPDNDDGWSASIPLGSSSGTGQSVFFGFSADGTSNWHANPQAGDQFIRFVTATTRPAESATTWSAGLRIRGDQGPQGAAGAAGAQGAQGQQGPAGADGATGPQGAQGEFTIEIFLNSTTTPSAAPTGGSFNITTGVITPPAGGWTATQTAPTSGQTTFLSRARINPAAQTSPVTPTWGHPVEAGAVGPTGPAGAMGTDGAQGAQGQFLVYQYQNAATIPGAPTGGTYNITSGVLTPSAGWTATPSTPTAGQATWFTQALVNPATQSGTVNLTWSAVLEAGGTGPQGPQGEQGPQGQQGQQGPAGAAGTNGADGAMGAQGAQGIYTVDLFGNFASLPGAAPTATVTVSTGAVSGISAGWTVNRTNPPTGQRTYVSTANINPAVQSGNVTPSFSTPSAYSGERGEQGPQGQQGQQGAQGGQGPQGQQGPAGSAGADGAMGAQGQQGAAGADGADGARGPQGAQGEFTIEIFLNSATTPSAAPTGGSFNIETAVITPPAGGWTVTQTAPAAGQTTFLSRARINPAAQTTPVTPTWGHPVAAGAVGPTGPAGPTGAMGAQGQQGPMGNPGAAGVQGAQGQFFVYQYQNAATIPANPTGGTYNLATGTLTPSAGWTANPATPPGGQVTWFTQALVNPATQSGTVNLTWSAILEAGGTGPEGPQGPQGVQGPAGAAGAAGADGTDGAQGAQGIYEVELFGNFAVAPSTAPTATVNPTTGVASAITAGWSQTPTSAPTGERTYVSRASINPATNTASFQPTFSIPSAWSGEAGSGGGGSTTDVIDIRPMQPLYRATSGAMPGIINLGSYSVGTAASGGYRLWSIRPTGWSTTRPAANATNTHVWLLPAFQRRTRDGWQTTTASVLLGHVALEDVFVSTTTPPTPSSATITYGLVATQTGAFVGTPATESIDHTVTENLTLPDPNGSQFWAIDMPTGWSLTSIRNSTLNIEEISGWENVASPTSGQTRWVTSQQPVEETGATIYSVTITQA